MASKIKIEVSKISKQIEVQILHYQHLRSNWSSKLADNFPKATFNDIVNHGSNFWKSLDLAVDNDTNIPRIVINHSIQHFNNFKRAEEEINLIPIELNRLYTFWINQKLEIVKILQQLEITNNLFEESIYYLQCTKFFNYNTVSYIIIYIYLFRKV